MVIIITYPPATLCAVAAAAIVIYATNGIYNVPIAIHSITGSVHPRLTLQQMLQLPPIVLLVRLRVQVALHDQRLLGAGCLIGEEILLRPVHQELVPPCGAQIGGGRWNGWGHVLRARLLDGLAAAVQGALGVQLVVDQDVHLVLRDVHLHQPVPDAVAEGVVPIATEGVALLLPCRGVVLQPGRVERRGGVLLVVIVVGVRVDERTVPDDVVVVLLLLRWLIVVPRVRVLVVDVGRTDEAGRRIGAATVVQGRRGRVRLVAHPICIRTGNASNFRIVGHVQGGQSGEEEEEEEKNKLVAE